MGIAKTYMKNAMKNRKPIQWKILDKLLEYDKTEKEHTSQRVWIILNSKTTIIIIFCIFFWCLFIVKAISGFSFKFNIWNTPIELAVQWREAPPASVTSGSENNTTKWTITWIYLTWGAPKVKF